MWWCECVIHHSPATHSMSMSLLLFLLVQVHVSFRKNREVNEVNARCQLIHRRKFNFVYNPSIPNMDVQTNHQYILEIKCCPSCLFQDTIKKRPRHVHETFPGFTWDLYSFEKWMNKASSPEPNCGGYGLCSFSLSFFQIFFFKI